MLLRRDGQYAIFVIEHHTAEGWRESSLDHFGHPPGFSASDVCWQRTGIHGTFDTTQALHALAFLAERHKNTKFRIVRKDLTQRSTVFEFGRP